MFGTTTWPIAMTPPHAAPAGPSPEPGATRRIRVTRRAVRTHRQRRGIALPTIRRAETYVVRLRRPVDCEPPRIVRGRDIVPHRERVAG